MNRNRAALAEASAFSAELGGKIAGEVRFDIGARALYASDLSIYRQIPIGVVIPRDVQDVIETAAIARKYGAPILARGCGTSLAGQCCNVAVILDFSKYMNRIVNIDETRKTALVQPGVINDEIRNAAERFHLTFGPDPATHAYCTIGGNIGNNSCGAHSVMAGKTADNVEELDILTYDGLRMRVGPASAAVINEIIRQGGRRGEIYSRLRALRDRYADQIRTRFPKIPRRVSGYNLDELLPENGFNVARALVGSESTCALVLNATLKLVESPPNRALLIAGYPDVFHLADHSAEIRSHGPIALECFTEHVVQNLERKGNYLPGAKLLPPGSSWLMAEFGGSSREEANQRARDAADEIRGADHDQTGVVLLDDPAEQGQIWHIRESGVAASRVPGVEDTWPAWEDAAVAPEKLGPYLRDFAKLVAKFRYKWTLFGHFGDGCVHTRMAFDLKTKAGVRRFRSFMYEAADLVVDYGGSLSGEHGDGQAKGELLVKMFGPELIGAFREFKEIWDPLGKMNPGKIVDAYRMDENLREGPDYRPRKVRTHFRFPNDHGSFAEATERCFGIGKCRNLDSGTMCPSFKATREEMHSTRGRAHLLFEMMRGDTIKKGWRDPHVKEALDLCLSCKGCKNDCPVSVDMATYKAEFLSHYYKGRLRPADAYAMGLIQVWAPLLARAPRIVNALARNRQTGTLMKSLAGLAQERDLPEFAPESFTSWIGRRQSRKANSRQVILWPDTFNNYFMPDTAKAAVEVLEAAGYRV
ncbi:MAG: FAD-linked oxidase C-terminal domain-containing protein, partial [Candidatus Binataceae bacterium]